MAETAAHLLSCFRDDHVEGFCLRRVDARTHRNEPVKWRPPAGFRGVSEWSVRCSAVAKMRP